MVHVLASLDYSAYSVSLMRSLFTRLPHLSTTNPLKAYATFHLKIQHTAVVHVY